MRYSPREGGPPSCFSHLVKKPPASSPAAFFLYLDQTSSRMAISAASLTPVSVSRLQREKPAPLSRCGLFSGVPPPPRNTPAALFSFGSDQFQDGHLCGVAHASKRFTLTERKSPLRSRGVGFSLGFPRRQEIPRRLYFHLDQTSSRMAISAASLTPVSASRLQREKARSALAVWAFLWGSPAAKKYPGGFIFIWIRPVPGWPSLRRRRGGVPAW